MILPSAQLTTLLLPPSLIHIAICAIIALRLRQTLFTPPPNPRCLLVGLIPFVLARPPSRPPSWLRPSLALDTHYHAYAAHASQLWLPVGSGQTRSHPLSPMVWGLGPVTRTLTYHLSLVTRASASFAGPRTLRVADLSASALACVCCKSALP